MQRLMLGMAALVALALVAGCGKKDGQAPVKEQHTMQEKQIKEAQTGAAQAVDKAQAEVKAGAAEVEGEAKAATSTFDKLVAEARTLLADKKYQDALAKLQAGLQMPALDEGQKSTLEKLIEQAKAALKTGVAKDVQDKAADLLKGVGGK